MRSTRWVVLAVGGGALALALSAPAQTVLVDEGFDDADLAARGWYDRVEVDITTDEHTPGSRASAELRFEEGATEPGAGAGLRIRFAETPRVHLSFWIKHSASWTGSDRPWHPHLFYLLTNLDGPYVAPASTHLTVYVEENEGEPVLAIQDAENIDLAQVGADLTRSTEARAVAGCNGDLGDAGRGTCYEHGGRYRNGRFWRAGAVFFGSGAERRGPGGWRHVEVLVELNSVRGGRAVADGVLRYWVDGELAIDVDDAVMRTGRHADMRFNQLLLGPYIGDGSPVEQTLWLDELVVATERPAPRGAPRAEEPLRP